MVGAAETSKMQQSRQDEMLVHFQPLQNGELQDNESHKATEVSRERQEKANKIKASAKKYLERLDDEFEESSDDEEINDGEILNNTLKNYRNTSEGIKYFKFLVKESLIILQ